MHMNHENLYNLYENPINCNYRIYTRNLLIYFQCNNNKSKKKYIYISFCNNN